MIVRESIDPSMTIIALNVEQDREFKPKIIKLNNYRATLPLDYDPECIAKLYKLLNYKLKKELEKISIDTI
jgi:hypothetical protein